MLATLGRSLSPPGALAFKMFQQEMTVLLQ